MGNEGRILRAVIQWTDSTFMDWPEFTATEFTETPRDGAVFVLDGDGTQVGFRRLGGPGLSGADRALQLMGWSRRGEWLTDSFGRPAAAVLRIQVSEGAVPSAVLPTQGRHAAWSEPAALPV